MIDLKPKAKCWICSVNDANSREHKTKRSDLQSEYGKPSSASPLFLHDARGRKNWRIYGLNDPLLKFRAHICQDCNTTRTQPYDRAWERMSLWLRSHTLRPGDLLRSRAIFQTDTKREMLRVHLYFVKMLGCAIMEAATIGQPIPIDLQPFADAIMKGRAHVSIYLTFGCGATYAGEPWTGWTNPKGVNINGQGVLLDWHYLIGGVGAHVSFVADGFRRPPNAWHPRFGVNKLVLADLRHRPFGMAA